LTVDVTKAIIAEAKENACQLVLAHHPLLMRSVHTIAETTGKGSLLSNAVRAGIAIFAAHTNADVVADGVSDTFAKQLGLSQIRPLVSTQEGQIGHGRIGAFDKPVSLGDLAVALGRLLPPTAQGVKVAGDFSQQVSMIALCGGAGDSFIADAAVAGADVYITSDLRHHPVQEARENFPQLAFIDVAHWASESLWLESAARMLSERHPDIEWIVSQVRTDPWDFVVTQ
ncbi:MAG: hypothetical protein RL670_1003, partial [Actinomycetota bacterium]